MWRSSRASEEWGAFTGGSLTDTHKLVEVCGFAFLVFWGFGWQGLPLLRQGARGGEERGRGFSSLPWDWRTRCRGGGSVRRVKGWFWGADGLKISGGKVKAVRQRECVTRRQSQIATGGATDGSPRRGDSHPLTRVGGWGCDVHRGESPRVHAPRWGFDPEANEGRWAHWGWRGNDHARKQGSTELELPKTERLRMGASARQRRGRFRQSEWCRM